MPNVIMGVEPNQHEFGLSQRLQEMNRLHQPVWVFDVDQARVCWGNQSSLEMWQADSLESLVERDMSLDMTETVAQRLRQYQCDFEQDPSISFKELWTLFPNDKPCTMEVVYSGIRLDDGRMAMFCQGLKEPDLDVETLRSVEALLHTSVMITLYTASGEPLYRNPAARKLAHSAEETLSEHFSSSPIVPVLLGENSSDVSTVACVNTVDGAKWHDVTATRCVDAVSGEHAWLISEVDVSKLKATEERAQFLAEHDLLTSLPNRNYVSVAFQNKIDLILAQELSGALIFIDLDRFKDVNDTLGHAAGDELLIEVSKRLVDIVRDGDEVARLGGDEFLLMLGPLDEDTSPEQLAKRVIDSISQPMIIQGREIKVTPSIGISLFPENGRNILDLMRHSDLAMYHAKECGRNDFAFFSQNLSDAVESRINLESDIARALEERQFVTYFQPRVDVSTNRIVGVEALARWIHPTRGLISPAEFIPACESSGLIGALSQIILEQSVRAQVLWMEQGHNISVSVNLSPLQFAQETLVDDLLGIVKGQGCDPSQFELEITESVLLGHDSMTIRKIEELVQHGFGIAIDDFGTGYSNLAYLNRYPIRCLKIDRSFVQTLDSAEPIVELIVSMARLFDFRVVAEGVETQEQLDLLTSLGCHEYQGYLFGRPMDYETCTQFICREPLRSIA